MLRHRDRDTDSAEHASRCVDADRTGGAVPCACWRPSDRLWLLPRRTSCSSPHDNVTPPSRKWGGVLTTLVLVVLSKYQGGLFERSGVSSVGHTRTDRRWNDRHCLSRPYWQRFKIEYNSKVCSRRPVCVGGEAEFPRPAVNYRCKYKEIRYINCDDFYVYNLLVASW